AQLEERDGVYSWSDQDGELPQEATQDKVIEIESPGQVNVAVRSPQDNLGNPVDRQSVVICYQSSPAHDIVGVGRQGESRQGSIGRSDLDDGLDPNIQSGVP